MFPILPPFSSPVKNISEFFKFFRKFFQEAFKDFQISPTKKVYNFHINFYGNYKTIISLVLVGNVPIRLG
jgi:hypothetical protein